MDIYILNASFQKASIIDMYESFIWTERFNSHGDFELVIPEGQNPSEIISLGTMISIDPSHRVMVVETSERTVDGEGRAIRKLKGRSLEATILGSRVAMPILAPISSGFMKWNVAAEPLNVIKEFYDALLRTGYRQIYDLIPELEPHWLSTSPLPLGDIPFPEDIYQFELDNDDMYSTIKRICDTFNLGFRILKDPDRGKINFSVYTGFDRTTGQSNNSAVVFSQSLENLTDSSELESIANLKNVAYVFAQNGYAIVGGNGFDETVSGLDRKVIRVVADDLELSAGPTLDSAMQRRGLEALGQCRTFSGFDGEVSNSSYVYGRDYFVGDLVEIQNDRGWSSYVRVTEQIFSSDNNGDKQYPTLTTELTLTPGTWLGWPPTDEWADVDDYWSDV